MTTIEKQKIKMFKNFNLIALKKIIINVLLLRKKMQIIYKY